MRPMAAMCDRIRKARVNARLSQTQLAKVVGVHRSAVVQWEREGGTCPSVTNLAAIAVVMRVHFEWLATGRGPGLLEQEAVPPGVRQQDEREIQILEILRRMPPRKRQVVRTILELLPD